MAFERICLRKLPDGSFRKVYPFHVSLEGMAKLALCRDEEDYDVMVKYLFVCARRKNVLVVIYIAMSNHGHATILTTGQEAADAFKVEWLRMYSQYFSHKYRQKKVLRHTSAVALYLDSDWYVRNTLAYVPKNALDALSRVEDYRWSGYRGMFCGGKTAAGFRPAGTLKRREKESCFHTHDSLKDLPWILNADGELEPASTCDYEYLESAFKNDQAFFLRTIGTVNMAEMHQKLVDNPRQDGSTVRSWTCPAKRRPAFFPTSTGPTAPRSPSSPVVSIWNQTPWPAWLAVPVGNRTRKPPNSFGLGAGGAFWRSSPSSSAQASGGFGAGHQPSWRKCGFRVGTCARKWALAHSGGAGHTPFSTPAPELGHTCAKARYTCARTWTYLHQDKTRHTRAKAWQTYASTWKHRTSTWKHPRPE